ncbi:MAG TPA: hypothetical protein VJJ02_05385 [Candidatus Paceibacterota bacterium]
MSLRAQTLLSYVLAVLVFGGALVVASSVEITLTAESFTKEDLAPLFQKMPPTDGHHYLHPKEGSGGVEI